LTAGEQLITSPMLFAYRGRDGRLAACDARGGGRFRLSGHRAAEIVTAFLEPRSAESAEQEGFTAEELREAREAGILVSGEEAESLGLWERNGWSRPAFLMFSQMDVPFREFDDGDDGHEAVASRRRETIEDYQSADPYPQPSPLAAGAAIDLPEPPPSSPGLSALTSRRSLRAFSSSPPHIDQMAGVLHAATESFRTFAGDRAGGDPFRLLNSFYSWAHLFAVVQDVEGVPRGVFEYDWMEHRLIESADPPDDEALLACLQGQRWVLGTGFVVFVVADLGGFAWLYRSSRAYLHVLIQVGQLGQELLMAATALGLGGWTSPAVHESRSAGLLGLPDDDALEVLSMVKLALPRR
jgi:SagB-type dehydrogenase family enzyme